MYIRLSALTLLLSGCDRSEPDERSTPPGSTEDTGAVIDSAHTGIGSSENTPVSVLYVGMTFGVDADGRSFTTVRTSSGDVRPAAWFTWGPANWNGDVNTAACRIDVWLEGATLAVDPTAAHPLSLTLTEDLPHTSNCDDAELAFFGAPASDPTEGTLPPVTGWTFSFGGELSPGVWPWVDSSWDEAEMVGADVRSPLVAGGGSSNVFVYGFEVDEDNVLRAGPIPMLADDLIRSDGTAAQASYTFRVPWLIVYPTWR